MDHDRLYHGSRYPGILSELKPSEYEQTKNGIHARWLFATHRRDQAVLFAAPFPPGGSFLTTLDPRESSSRLLLFANESKESLLARPVQGFVYELPSAGFTQVRNMPREWVCKDTVAVPPQTPLAVTQYRQVLEAGVQVFTLAPQAPEGFLANLCRTRDGGAEGLARLVVQPHGPLVWLNQEYGLAQDPDIRRAFASLSQPAHIQPSGPAPQASPSL